MMREVVVEDEVEWWWCRSSGGWLSQGSESIRAGGAALWPVWHDNERRRGRQCRGERIDAAIVVASLLPLIRLARQTGSDYSTTKRLCDEE